MALSTHISQSDINMLWILQTQYAISCPEYCMSEDAAAIMDARVAFKIG
jgi:hypothetical protein